MSACIIYSVKRFDSSTAFSINKKKLYIPNLEYVYFQYLIHLFIHSLQLQIVGLQPVHTKCTAITSTYYTEAILTRETTCSGMAIWRHCIRYDTIHALHTGGSWLRWYTFLQYEHVTEMRTTRRRILKDANRRKFLVHSYFSKSGGNSAFLL